jgi:hypothetical protein
MTDLVGAVTDASFYEGATHVWSSDANLQTAVRPTWPVG